MLVVPTMLVPVPPQAPVMITSVPQEFFISTQAEPLAFTVCKTVFTVVSVSVDVSKVKLASHSIVPSPVHTHIWLSTGVHTLLTFQAPAGTLQVLSHLKNVVPSGVPEADNIAISTAPLAIVVVIQVVPEPVTSPDNVIVWFACKALSAKSSEAFTEASSFVSSIDPATIEALICCPVNVKSISELSETVTSPLLVPDRLPSFVISLEVTNLFVVLVSSISSASRTTTPV